MDPTKAFTGEKYNLRWNSYQTVLINYLGDHLLREEHVDVTFACEGKILKAHKLILSACSSYFRDLFQSHTVANPVILLNNVKFEQFKYLIDFIYNGEIKVVDSDLGDVLMLASNLKIRGLSNIKYTSFVKKVDNNSGDMITQQTSTDNKNLGTDKEGQQPQVSEGILKKQLLKKSHKKTKFRQRKSKVTLNEQIPKANIENNSVADSSTNLQNSLALLNRIEEEQNESQMSKKRKLNELNNEKQSVTLDTVEEISSSMSIKDESVEVGETVLMSTNNDSDHSQPVEVLKSSKQNSSHTQTNEPLARKSVSAFMIFANEWRKKIAVEHPDESNRQISVRLSSMWKNLSDETKETFYTTAKKAFEEQKKKNDDIIR